MDNQHRKIKGYRELDEDAIAMMNRIKEDGERLQELVDALHKHHDKQNEMHGTPDAESRRWTSIGKTHLQQGIMALVRSVALPESF